MSDMFNHELDAWEDHENRGGDYENYSRKRRRSYRVVKFDRVKHETQKAFLFNIKWNDFWVPKALCKWLDREKRTVEIRSDFKSDIFDNQ